MYSSGEPKSDGSRSSSIDQEIPLERTLELTLDQTCALIMQTDAMIRPHQHHKILSEKFSQLVRSLQEIQTHLIFIQKLLLLECSEDASQFLLQNEHIAEKYQNLNSKNDISRLPLQEGINFYETTLIPDLRNALAGCLVRMKSQEIVIYRADKKASQFETITNKLVSFQTFLPELATFNHEDIFSQDKFSESWQELYKISKFKDFESWEEMQSSLSTLYASTPHRSPGKSPEGKRGRLKVLFDEYVLDSTIVKNIKKITTAIDKTIYIERLFPKITEDLLKDEYDHLPYTHLMDIVAPEKTYHGQAFENLFVENPERVQIRLISSKPMILQGKKREKVMMFAGKASQMLNFNKDEDTESSLGIVIYLHGGGFVSRSSNLPHEYLLHWAHNMNKVLFTINYRQGPEYPYPAALDDVWQAYLWIKNYLENVLSIVPGKIIIVGHQSGANLALALILRLIKVRQETPDGCLLISPLTNLDFETFVPSRLWLAENHISSLNVEGYTAGKFDPKIDFFLSPIKAPDNFLADFPPMRILMGAKDPFYDETWRFIAKLREILSIKMGEGIQTYLRTMIHKEIPEDFLRSENSKNYDHLLVSMCELIQGLFEVADD